MKQENFTENIGGIQISEEQGLHMARKATTYNQAKTSHTVTNE